MEIPNERGSTWDREKASPMASMHRFGSSAAKL